MEKTVNNIDIKVNFEYLYDYVLEEKIRTTSFDIAKKLEDSQKEVMIDLLNSSREEFRKDPQKLKIISRKIESWQTEEDIINRIANKLKSIYCDKGDVSKLYVNKEGKEICFVVIIDDASSDNILTYNEMGFGLAEKFLDIKDFYVIDIDEARGCSDMFEDYKMIYKRG